MIAPRKSFIPPLPNPYLERPGLIRRLVEGLGAGKRATIVRAGPGMGKTALLAGYARHMQEDGVALALWCDLTRADRDAAVFCRRIHNALRREVPELSAQAVETATSLGQAGLAQAMGLLCDDLEEALAGRALVLVLDDAQHLPDDPDFMQGLEALMRYFPEDAQLVLAGRALPPLKLSQFQLRNQLVLLEDADLRFRPGEIADLAEQFDAEVGGSLGEEHLIELASRAQGWPAGIVHALATGSQASGPDLLHAYLQEEVLDALPVEVRESLAAAAFLEGSRIETLRAMLGPRSPDRLAAEPTLRPFLVVDGDGVVLQPILREAVERSVLESWPEAERDTLFRRLAAAAADPGEAIGFLQRARCWQEAEAALLAGLAGFLGSGRIATARDLAAGFPEGERRRPGLQYVSGELARREGRLDQAVRLLSEAERSVAERSVAERSVAEREEALLGAICAGLAAAHGARGDVEQQRAYAQRGLEIVDPADHGAIGACWNALAMYHVYLQDLGTARPAFEDAMRHYREAGDVAGQVRVQHNMGLAWSRTGDFGRAISHYREAIRLAQAHHLLPLALTYNNLALCEIYLGRLEGAGKALEQGMALAARLMSLRDRSVLLRTMARLQMEAGAFEDARAFFESSLDEAMAAGDRLAQMYGYFGMAELHLKQGRHREADAAVDHGLEAAGLPAGDPRTAESLILRAMAAVQGNRPSEAEAHLTAFEDTSAGTQSAYSRFQIARLRAQAAAQAGNKAEAARHAAAAVELARDFGFPLGTELSGPEFQAAQEPGSGGVPESVNAPGSGEVPAGDGSLTAPGSMAVRAEDGSLTGPGAVGAEETAGQGEEGAVAPALDVMALGAFRVQVDGKPVPPGAWKISKAKIAMAYLLLHPVGATKDALLDLLYPGEDPARTAVNMVLSRLRGALEPDSPKGAPSRFVLFQDGRYTLNQGVRTRFDAIEFRRLVKLARDPALEADRRRTVLEQAIALYQGPFMEGFEESAWIDIERENLRRMMKEACSEVFGLTAASDDWKGLERAADALLERDPESQEGFRARILALALQERREEAVRACQAAQDLLTGKVRVDLDPETEELLELVRDDRLTIRAARSLLVLA